jgi:WD40 repeat protein
MVSSSTNSRAWLWWQWIAMGMLTPTLYLLGGTLIGRDFSATRPLLLIGLAGFGLLLVPALLQGLVLRSFFAKLNLFLWLGAVWGTYPLMLLCHFLLIKIGVNENIFLQYQAVHSTMQDWDRGGSLWQRLAHLPWGNFLLTHLTFAVIVSLLPVLVVAKYAKYPPWRLLPWFVLPAVAGSMLFIALHQPQFDYGLFRHVADALFVTSSANDRWPQIGSDMWRTALVGGMAAVLPGYGLARALTIERGTQRPLYRTAAAIHTVLSVLMMVTITTLYVTGPVGSRANFYEIRYALSKAPVTDTSRGQPVLRFSRKLALPVATWFYQWSPDGTQLLLATKERALRKITVADGTALAVPVLRQVTLSAMAWSPDGRYILTREDGPRRNGKYGDYSGLLRLLDAKTLQQIGQLQGAYPQCPFGTSLKITADSRAAWISCNISFSATNNSLAVQVSLPDLARIQTIRRTTAYNSEEGYARPDGIFMHQGKAYISVFGSSKEYNTHTIFNLETGNILKASPEMQQMLNDSPKIEYCGTAISVHGSGLSRSFPCNPLTGQTSRQDKLSATDKSQTHDSMPLKLKFDLGAPFLGHNPLIMSSIYNAPPSLIISLATSAASKTGHILVWDAATGAQLQDITTAAYDYSSQVSPDGRHLAVRPKNDDRSLVIYDISTPEHDPRAP